TSMASAQYTETIQESFAAESEVNIRHRRGPIKVIKASDGKVSYEASIRFDAANETEAQKLKKALKVNAGSKAGRIDILSTAEIKNMRTINGRSTIELNDGTKIKGIKKLRIELVVKVPDVKILKVDSRYHEVEIDVGVSELLTVNTYSAEIDIADIKGDLELADKYSKGTVGSFKNAKMELYESKIQFGSGQEAQINAKYSTLRFPQLAALATESYESKFYIGPVKGKMEINDKYSKFEFGDIQDALIDIYESDITAGNVQNVQIKSKYADLRFTSVQEINFASSYEDEFTAREVGSLRAANSKYGVFKMEKLTNTIEFDSYEDNITVESPTSSLEAIRIKGKYTNLNCPLSSSTKFMLNMEGRYGSIDLDEDDLDYTTYIKKGDTLKLAGKRNNATEADAKIEFNCYECKIRLKN
ncbi:MAG: hypothetical protein AAF705_09380, partial [Bacteroidota bacterium]